MEWWTQLGELVHELWRLVTQFDELGGGEFGEIDGGELLLCCLV